MAEVSLIAVHAVVPGPTERLANVEEKSMVNANVSKCANPQCEHEFKKLGDGKLFVRRAEKGDKDSKQKALWLCADCSLRFDLRYDRRLQEYLLVRRRRAA
jgi:hypothetical protein